MRKLGKIQFVLSLGSMVAMIMLAPLTLKSNTDYRTVEEETRRLFLEQKWDSVIVVGKTGLKEKIDYFYLRQRMGISYYWLGKYFNAITHLEKAREFNSSDTTTLHYLFRSYKNAGREAEARSLMPAMGTTSHEGDVYRNFSAESVHAESGYTVSSDRSPDNLATMMEEDSIYGEQDLYGNNFYSNAGFKLHLFKKAELSLAYNYLDFDKTKYIQYGRREAQLDSVSENPFSIDYFYSYPWKIHDTSFFYHVKQHEAYAGLSVALPRGFKVRGAVHYLHDAYPVTSPVYRWDSIDDTAYYQKYDSTWHLFRYPSLVYSFQQKDTSFSNWVVYAGISKEIGIFNAGLSGSWSDLNGMKQWQVNGVLTYFPLGNLNLYGTTAISGFFQGSESRLLLSQVLGGRITPRMWGEANFSYGDFSNANILGGSIVYNNSDIIDYMGGATLFFLAGSHLQFSLIYQYNRKQSQQLYYIKTEETVNGELVIKEVPQVKNNPYHTKSITGGITWKF